MKKITYLFKSFLLFLALVLTTSIHSCKKSFMYSDYTYELKAETKAPEMIYKNTPIAFELKLNGNDILNEDVKIKYLGTSLNGELRRDNSVIKIADEIIHKFKTPLALVFTPSAVGSGSLEFEASFEGDVKKISVPLTVNEAAYNFVVINKRDTLNVGTAVDMQAKITENEEVTKLFKTRSGDSKLTLTAVMGKGSGVLFFNNKPIFANALTKSAPVSISVTPEDLIDMKYSPLSHGENRIDMTISDEYRNSVIIPVSFNVDSTDFVATITSLVDSVELNKVLLFDLKVPIPGYKGALNVTPKLLSGSGRFAINGRNYATDTPFKLDKAGDYVLSFTPTSQDPVQLHLKIGDDYGQYSEVELVCKVFVPQFYLQSNFDSNLPVRYKDHAVFTLSMTDALPTRYTCIATTTPVEALNSVLYIDDKQVPLNKVFTYDPKIKNIEFVSSLCGVVTLKFELTKDNGKSNFIDIPITVSPFALDFSIKSQSTTETKIGVPITFDLSMFEERYDSTYTIKVTQLQGEGSLLFEGDPYQESKKFLEGRTNGLTPLEYTPMTAGTHEIEFELKDHWGQIKTSLLTVSTGYAPIIVLPSVTALVTDVESPASLSLTASEVGYTGDFYLSYTGGSGEVLVGSSNETLAVGQSRKIANNNPVMLTYTPNTVGDHVLEFAVMDIHGQKSHFTVNVKSNNIPLTITTSFQSAANGENYPKVVVPVNITVSGAFPITVTLTNNSVGSGIFTRNGTTVSKGSPITLSSSEIWQYTPNVRSIGTNTFEFKANDRFNQEATSTSSIEVKYRPFNPTVSLYGSSLYLNIQNQIIVSSDRYPVRLQNTNASQWRVYDYITGNSLDGITINEPREFYITPTDQNSGAVVLKAFDSDNQEVEISTPILRPIVATLNHNFSPSTSTVLKNVAVTSTLTTSNTQNDKQFTLLTLKSDKSGSFNLSAGIKISNSASITYTPTEVGRHTITSEVRDNQGLTKTAKWIVNVTSAAIELSCNAVTGKVGTDLSVTLNIKKNNYSGTFNVSVTKSAYPGDVTLPGSGVTGQGNYYFQYKPLNISNHTINVTVTDSEGGSTTIGVQIRPLRDPLVLLTPSVVTSSRSSCNVPLKFKQSTTNDVITFNNINGGKDPGIKNNVNVSFIKPLPYTDIPISNFSSLSCQVYANSSEPVTRGTYDLYIIDIYGDVHIYGIKASSSWLGGSSYDTRVELKYFE